MRKDSDYRGVVETLSLLTLLLFLLTLFSFYKYRKSILMLKKLSAKKKGKRRGDKMDGGRNEGR